MRTTFGNMTNYRIPKKLTRKTTPYYPPIIQQPHHHATTRYNISGGAVDDDDDIFVGESVSAQELVSRARAKAEARNEIIVVDDDEDSPPRNINPPQPYPPTIHQPQPLTMNPAASNQALMFLPVGVTFDANALTDDCTGATFIIDRHPFPMAQQAPGDEDDPLLRPSVKPPKLNEISTANVYTNPKSVSAQELVSRARAIPGTNNENQAKSRPDENANQAGLFSPINPAYEDEDDDRSIVIPPPAANENVNVVTMQQKEGGPVVNPPSRNSLAPMKEKLSLNPIQRSRSLLNQNTNGIGKLRRVNTTRVKNKRKHSHMEGGGYYPISPYQNVQPPPFMGMPPGAYDHGHDSCSYHQGDAPHMNHQYHSGYGMYTPCGQGPLPPPYGPGRGQIVGQGVGPPPQVPVRPREGPTGANLFIHRLPYDLTDADLATAFNPFGNVISATVIVDRYTGESKGFGFVSYDSITSAELALEQMNGFQLGNTRIYVERKRVSHRSPQWDLLTPNPWSTTRALLTVPTPNNRAQINHLNR